MKQCKKCGTPMDADDVICPQCGMDQRSEVSGQKSRDEDQRSEVSRQESEPQQPATNSKQPGTQTPNPESRIPDLESAITVLWNTARKFVEGTTGLFNLRLSPKEGLEHLEIAVVSDVPALPGLYKKLGNLAAGKEIKINLPLSAPAGSAGEIPFDIFLRFKQNGEQKILCASQSHHIYREEHAPQAVHYHSETNVNSGDGHANDQHVNIVGGDMPNLSQTEKKALWEEINAQENWEPLDLQATNNFPEEELLRKNSTKKDNAGSALRTGGESDRKRTRKKRERKVILLAGIGAASVLLLAWFFAGQKEEASPPVQVNVVQQSGDGTYNAVVGSSPKPQPEQKPPFKKAKPVVTEPVVTAEGDLDVEFELIGGRTEFREGEMLQYRVYCDRDCYMALLCHQSDGSTVVLFPNAWHRSAFVPGGQEILIPDAGSGFEIRVSPPFGLDTVELIACTERTDFHAMLSIRAGATTRGAPFVADRTAGLTRGLSAVPKSGSLYGRCRKTITVTTRP